MAPDPDRYAGTVAAAVAVRHDPGMSAWITHIGQATPERRIAQADLAAWLEPRLHPDADRRHFGRFAERSG
ncbi:MAG: hypothetical protein RLZZ127_2882, partial [Planctomycetota bacterium]